MPQVAVAANTMSIVAVVGGVAVITGGLFAGTGGGSESSRTTDMVGKHALVSVFGAWQTAPFLGFYLSPCARLRVLERERTVLLDVGFFSHFYFPASGQAVVTGVVHSSPRFWPSILIAHRV